MAIQVTCPKCFKRFQVSDKFAGKKGPCPNCKATIRVPEKNEEVVVHAPTDDAPKDSKGQSVLKPIKRKETDVTRRGLIITIGSVLLAIVAALGIRFGMESVPVWICGLAVIVIAPPLVWAGYSFVQDSELEGYTGQELIQRVAIASLCLAGTWLIYAFVPMYLFDLKSASEMDFVGFGIAIAAMLLLGGVICMATFELEFFSGLIHASFYLITTLLLAVLAGITLAGKPVKDDLDLEPLDEFSWQRRTPVLPIASGLLPTEIKTIAMSAEPSLQSIATKRHRHHASLGSDA
ncbi:MAG: hypothetical protein AAF958_18330 [Planctomycetota bacterium]